MKRVATAKVSQGNVKMAVNTGNKPENKVKPSSYMPINAHSVNMILYEMTEKLFIQT